MAIQDAKGDRQPGDQSKHAKVKVEIDDTDNKGETPTPPEQITGKGDT